MYEYKFHVVYKTTNLVNGKIYVGLHSTDKLDDGYLGSGWALKSALAKYGKTNFEREVLLVLESREEARDIEALLVDPTFILRPDTYNLQVGGMGVEDQWGPNNHAYGKPANNAKKVVATHKDGRVISAGSLRELQDLIGIDRANIRNLVRKGITGKRGWRVEQVIRRYSLVFMAT